MSRIRYLICAPNESGDGMVTLRPFKAALACADGLVHADLCSTADRPLFLTASVHTAESADDLEWSSPAHEILPPCGVIDLLPGASQRIRLGLRLGALHVERAFCIVLREILPLRRDASFFLSLRAALPIVVTPVEVFETRRAA